MKRGVQFAEKLSDEGSEELKRQQQADASPSNTGGGSDHFSVRTWKAEHEINGNDNKPIGGKGLNRSLNNRRFSHTAVDPSKLKEKEQVATCCFFGVMALKKTLELIASTLGLKKSAEPDLLDSSHFTAANAKLTNYQKGCARRALEEASLHQKSHLKKSEVMVMLRLLGHFPETWRIDCAMQELRMQTLDDFTFGEALHIWTYFLFFHEEELQMLKRAFQFFDRDSSGHITFEEMRDSNRELEDPLSDDEIRQFIDLLDKNGDGYLQYEDFFGIAENILGGGPNSAFNVEPAGGGREMFIPENSMIIDRSGLALHPEPQSMPEKHSNGNNGVKQPYLTRDDSALKKESHELEVESYQSASPLPPSCFDEESAALTKYGSGLRIDPSSRGRNAEDPVQSDSLSTSPTRQPKDGMHAVESTAISYDNFIPGGAKAVSTPEELNPTSFHIVRDDGKLKSSIESSDDTSTKASDY